MPRQKFLQIYSQLKQRIESGEYPVGQILPSENTLIGEFDCSRNTVRRAISELVRDGYVQTRQGWGVCNIFQPIEHSSYTMGMIESFRETARRTGQTGITRVVAFDTCVADEAIAAQTDFPVELATPQDRQWLELGEYNCLAVVATQVYNSEGVMFEYTQSRHYPGSFRFQDNAVRRPAES